MMGDNIFVEHDGLRFRCRVDGRTEGPWIVFSNSLLTDLTIWDAQVEVLAPHFRILRYDQRGHGGTSVPVAAANFDQLGNDLVVLLDHFGIERCAFVGLSMGVPTGFYLMRHQPSRVSRLVLCDGQQATAPGGAEAWEERIATARREGLEKLVRATMKRWFGEAFRGVGGHEAAFTAAAATELEGFVACARALQDYGFADVVPTITVPTLILVGANDGDMPAAMRSMRNAIRGAQMHVIAGAGHIPNLEQPEIFNRHLLEFLIPNAVRQEGSNL